MVEAGSARYVNKQGPSFPGCLGKKKKIIKELVF